MLGFTAIAELPLATLRNPYVAVTPPPATPGGAGHDRWGDQRRQRRFVPEPRKALKQEAERLAAEAWSAQEAERERSEIERARWLKDLDRQLADAATRQATRYEIEQQAAQIVASMLADLQQRLQVTDQMHQHFLARRRDDDDAMTLLLLTT